MKTQDPTTTNQIINYVIVDEYLKGRFHYAKRAMLTLREHGILTVPQKSSTITELYLQSIKNRLVNGEREPAFPAYFNGEVGPRHLKDQMYAALWRTCEMVLGNEPLRYCGLAAKNVEVISKKARVAHICETDPKTFKWLNKFYTLFKEADPGVKITNKDIFEHLNSVKTYSDTYNVLDLDLMISLNLETPLAQWANIIHKSTEKISVVNIVTCVGRGNSILQYHSLMPNFMAECFRKAGFKEVQSYSGKYRDRIVPMRYEHFVLRK